MTTDRSDDFVEIYMPDETTLRVQVEEAAGRSFDRITLTPEGSDPLAPGGTRGRGGGTYMSQTVVFVPAGSRLRLIAKHLPMLLWRAWKAGEQIR